MQSGVDTTLDSLTVITQMVKADEKLLNYLIIFLTMCPHGLGLTEIEILLRRFPSQQNPEVKDKHIRLYLDLFR